MSANHQWLEDMYAAFNARDIPAVLSRMTPEVDWPNASDGSRVLGQDAVRRYWTHQWTQISPKVTPIAIYPAAAQVLVAEVRQEVRDLSGKMVHEGVVYHVYTLKDGLVDRMDIRQEAP
jgi:ketosteroid isomerase-like protein